MSAIKRVCGRCGEAFTVPPPLNSDYLPALYVRSDETREDVETRGALIRASIRAGGQHNQACRRRRPPRRESSYAGDVHGLDGDSIAADIMQYAESDIAEHGIDGDDFDGIGFGGGNY